MSDDKTPTKPEPKKEEKPTQPEDREKSEEITEEQLKGISGGKTSYHL